MYLIICDKDGSKQCVSVRCEGEMRLTDMYRMLDKNITSNAKEMIAFYPILQQLYRILKNSGLSQNEVCSIKLSNSDVYIELYDDECASIVEKAFRKRKFSYYGRNLTSVSKVNSNIVTLTFSE